MQVRARTAVARGCPLRSARPESGAQPAVQRARAEALRDRAVRVVRTMKATARVQPGNSRAAVLACRAIARTAARAITTVPRCRMSWVRRRARRATVRLRRQRVPRVGRTVAPIPRRVARPTSHSLQTAARAETRAQRTHRCARVERVCRVVRRTHQRCAGKVVPTSTRMRSTAASATTLVLRPSRTPTRCASRGVAVLHARLASRSAVTSAWTRRATPQTAGAAISRVPVDRSAAVADACVLQARTTAAEPVRRTTRRRSAARAAPNAEPRLRAQSMLVGAVSVRTCVVRERLIVRASARRRVRTSTTAVAVETCAPEARCA